MATHSRVLAWRIPWTEEPGGLQSMGSHTRMLLMEGSVQLISASASRLRNAPGALTSAGS